MQFYSSAFLNLLWLTPVLALLFIMSGWLTRRRLSAFLKTNEIRGKLLPHYNAAEWPFRASLLLIAFIFSVLALSQPQWGEEKKKVERKGIDVIFMVDVSTSMLAEDIKPNRVRKAKFEIESFVRELKGDRIGMLTFAGSSFMQTPLTLDYSAFLIFLSGVGVGDVPDPGTSLGPAIQRAIESFPDDTQGQHAALVVFSDGEDHTKQIETAIALAKKKNVRIYTVGTATAEGSPIPLHDESGSQTTVKKDRNGNIVITKLNRELLEKVASETGGLYFPATPGEKEVGLIQKHLGSLGERKLEDRLITEREDHYQIFVFLALLCLMLEMLVRRGKPMRALPIPALFFFLMLHSGFINTPQSKIDEGNADFAGKRYQSAAQKYREVQVKNPDSPPVEYNLATSLYKMDEYQESAAHLKNAVEQSGKDPVLQAKAAYNYGNALYRTGDYEGAIAAYKKALELNPNDRDAKYNLEVIQNKKNKFEKENQDRKKDNPEKKDDKNKQQNSPNQQQQNQQQNQQNQGGGSSQDKNQQGQGGEDKQQGSGEQKQDQDQNQGGAGQSQQNSEKNQGQGEQQPDQKQQENQSDKSQNQGSGNSEQKENQSQDQKNQGEQQGQNSGQDQKDQSQQNQGSDQTDQQKQTPQGQGENQQNASQPQQPNGQNQNPPGSEGSDQQPGQKSEPGKNQGTGSQQQGQSGQPQQDQGGLAAGKPLQGQMSKEDAEYLLGSLEDGEKKLQVLRKPAKENPETAYAEKDW